MDTRARLDAFLAGIERRAYRMAYVATRHREDALDLVQDAMFALVRQYAQRPEAEWAPLFHTILHSRITDWARRRKVRNFWQRLTGTRDDAEDPMERVRDDSGVEPDRRMAGDAAMVALETAMQTLPLRQRQAFLLRVWEGLDVEQTARAMRCTAGSVKTHYSRAVHALREHLEEHE
jgi:RNA polymerase sigma-70 factor (ECF subfamily)